MVSPISNPAEPSNLRSVSAGTQLTVGRLGAGHGEVRGRHGYGHRQLGRRERAGEASVLVGKAWPGVPRLGPLVEEGPQRLVLLLRGGVHGPEVGVP